MPNKLLVLLGAFVCLSPAWAQDAPPAQTSPTKPERGAQILRPPQLADDVALLNPMSGLYTVIQQDPRSLNFHPLNPEVTNAAPLRGIPLNEYGRVSWHSLEPAEGQYDFSVIDNVLAPCSKQQTKPLCLPEGAQFDFRIMAMNPQVKPNTNITTGTDGYPVYSDLPSYIETGKHGWLLPVDPNDSKQGHYFIPDWNDPFVLNRVKALLVTLGQRYNGDPRIGWVDIGIYGSWGEWHTAGLPHGADYKGGIPYNESSKYYALNTQEYLSNNGKEGAYYAATESTKDFIVDAHMKAFPNTLLLMMTDDGDGLCRALKAPGSETRIGLRRDSLGSSNSWAFQFPTKLPNCDSEVDQNLILGRWKTAPFITEPFGSGGRQAFQCRTFETDRDTGSFNIEEQVQQFHVAAIANGYLCAGTWSSLSEGQQKAFLSAGIHSGYRFSPLEIHVSEPSRASSDKRGLSLNTYWTNTGATPAYNHWTVEFSLWSYDSSGAPRQEIARMTSKIDLRKILPTGTKPVIVEDKFELKDEMAAGRYELRIRVVDPKRYLNPMQLALQGETPEGYYPLGPVEIRGFMPR